jgi:hypothetical protein
MTSTATRSARCRAPGRCSVNERPIRLSRASRQRGERGSTGGTTGSPQHCLQGGGQIRLRDEPRAAGLDQRAEVRFQLVARDCTISGASPDSLQPPGDPSNPSKSGSWTSAGPSPAATRRPPSRRAPVRGLGDHRAPPASARCARARSRRGHRRSGRCASCPDCRRSGPEFHGYPYPPPGNRLIRLPAPWGGPRRTTAGMESTRLNGGTDMPGKSTGATSQDIAGGR